MVNKLCILIAVLLILTAGAYAQEDNDTMVYQDHDSLPEMSTFDGTVSNIDIVGSKLTVSGISKESFSVPLDAIIKRDALDIRLSDISIGDYATVDYNSDPSGKKIAHNITVDYGAE